MPCGADVARLVSAGDLHSARRAAAAASYLPAKLHAEPTWSGVVRTEAAALEFDAAAGRVCSQAWISAVDELTRREDALALVAKAHAPHAASLRTAGATDCFAKGTRHPTWDGCCSSLPSSHAPCPSLLASQTACCAFGNRSRTFLLLPALREISVQIALPNGRLLHIEQDGLLRPFDMSTVVWPAGYLLAQWAADPANCALWSGTRQRVLELGAGTGVASIAAATCNVPVLATDTAPVSLSLVVANAQLNGAASLVDMMAFDWHSDEHLERVAKLGPFTAVIGAALQFEAWLERLWYVLMRLAGAPERTLIALAHSAGSLPEPPASQFVAVGRVPGLLYGMHTAWADDESDFEIVLLERRQ